MELLKEYPFLRWFVFIATVAMIFNAGFIVGRSDYEDMEDSYQEKYDDLYYDYEDALSRIDTLESEVLYDIESISSFIDYCVENYE